MAAVEFNPKLATVVAKEFDGTDAKGKRHRYAPGEDFPWQTLGVEEGRVGKMVRTGFLTHVDRPLAHAARRQVARKASAKAEKSARPALKHAYPFVTQPKENVMNFGQAIEAMKSGRRVQRAGWNGKGMHLYLEDWLEGTLTFAGRKYQPCIVMLTATGQHQPGWLASQADMLAEDWSTVTDG